MNLFVSEIDQLHFLYSAVDRFLKRTHLLNRFWDMPLHLIVFFFGRIGKLHQILAVHQSSARFDQSERHSWRARCTLLARFYKEVELGDATDDRGKGRAVPTPPMEQARAQPRPEYITSPPARN